jgi:BirA family biotin operon repressor/biotin-[acetyl-CoA-carboxylase] ligase
MACARSGFSIGATDLAAIPLIHLGVVDSTQSFLVRHPELGFCGVLADAQTAGRGRGGNSWESAPGAGLWLSARLPIQPSAGYSVHSVNVLLQAMEAVAEILGPCGARLGIKWPNDLVAYKEKTLVKIGGIIGEQKKIALSWAWA